MAASKSTGAGWGPAPACILLRVDDDGRHRYTRTSESHGSQRDPADETSAFAVKRRQDAPILWRFGGIRQSAMGILPQRPFLTNLGRLQPPRQQKRVLRLSLPTSPFVSTGKQ